MGNSTLIVKAEDQKYNVRRSKSYVEFKTNLSEKTGFNKFRLSMNEREIINEIDFSEMIKVKTIDTVVFEVVQWTVKVENREYKIDRCDEFKELKKKIAETVKMYNFSFKIEGHDIENQEDLNPYVALRDTIIEVTEIVEWKVKIKIKDKDKDKKFSICRSDGYKDIIKKIKKKGKIRDFILKIRGKEITDEDFNIYSKMRNVVIEVFEINYWKVKTKDQIFEIHRYKIYEDLVNKITEKVSTNDFILKYKKKEIKNQEDLSNYVDDKGIVFNAKIFYWKAKTKYQIFKIYRYTIYRDLVNKISEKVNTNVFILNIDGREIKNQLDLSKYAENKKVTVDVNILYWKINFNKSEGESEYEIPRCYIYDKLYNMILEKNKTKNFFLTIGGAEIKNQFDLDNKTKNQNNFSYSRSSSENNIERYVECENYIENANYIDNYIKDKNEIIFVIENINEDNAQEGNVDCLFRAPKLFVDNSFKVSDKDGNISDVPILENGLIGIDSDSVPIEEKTPSMEVNDNEKKTPNLKMNGNDFVLEGTVTEKDLKVENSSNKKRVCLRILKSKNHSKVGITKDGCEKLTQTGIVPAQNGKGNKLTKANDISKCCYISKKLFDKTKIGAPVFSPSQKLIGIIGCIDGLKVYVYSILKLFKKKFTKIDVSPDGRTGSGNVDRRSIKPKYSFNENSYFYHFLSGQLIIYHDKNFCLNYIDVNLEIGLGATFTSTPYGLAIVYKNIAYNVTLEVEELAHLNYEHMYHSSVWHRDRLYVISGKDCKEVEYFDSNNTWQRAKPLPRAAKQNAAVCSVQDSIYLMAGLDNGTFSNSVLKFTENKWETLTWVSPWKYEGMGLLTYKNNLILFGGLKNRKYCELSINGKIIKEDYLVKTGDFSGMSFGEFEDSKYFFIDSNYLLRFSQAGKFDLISTTFSLT